MRGLVVFFALFVAVPAAANVLIGRSLWMTHCSGCHGELGDPIVPGTPDISRGEGADKSNRDRMKIIRNGSGIMPPYSGYLSDDDMGHIIVYMLTLYPQSSSPGLHLTDPNL